MNMNFDFSHLFALDRDLHHCAEVGGLEPTAERNVAELPADGGLELTTERDVAVLPADGRVGGVAPGPRLLAAGVSAVVLGAGQLGEQRDGVPVPLGVLAVPALTQDTLGGGVHPALIEPAAAPHTVV